MENVGLTRDIENILQGLTTEQMKEAEKIFKEKLKKYKEEYKEQTIEEAKKIVEEGAVLKVRYKEDVVQGTVISVREKTFTLLVEDDLGNPKKIPRNYNAVIL
jgi:predicted HicB family RNase H-like nuclease